MNKKLIIFIILFNFILLGCQYVFTSLRATDGQLLADLDAELQIYSSENLHMHNTIFAALALNKVDKLASEKNMVTVQTNFLSPNPVAAVIVHP